MNPAYETMDTLELIRRTVDGTASAEDFQALQTRLLNDAEARRQFSRYANLHCALGNGRLVARAQVDQTVAPARIRSTFWFQWRPLTAAVAGVVFGLFSASVAWAYAGARLPEVKKFILQLANADFESEAQPSASGIPRQFGIWSGDFSRATPAEQGIQPASGQRMLRVLRSASEGHPSGVASHGGDLMQLVDLRPFKAEFASGHAVLEISAAGNMTVPQTGKSSRFIVSAAAFSGQPDELGSAHNEMWEAALASGMKRVLLDVDPATWQTGTARLLLPADADFAMVKFTVKHVRPKRMGHAEFPGHYLDNVKIVLKTQPVRLN